MKVFEKLVIIPAWVGKEGWSLLEVVIGLAFLSLLTVQFLAVAANTAFWVQEAGRESQASNYAYGVLAVIHAEEFEFLIPAANAYQIDLQSLEAYFPAPEGMEVSAKAFVRKDVSNLQQVIVQVKWSETNYVELQTLMAY